MNELSASLLSAFPPATPELLDERELLQRVDTKFLILQSQLPTLLRGLHDHYAIVLARDTRRAHYQTIYFDSERFQCFEDHRRGRRPRSKIRIRHYLDREVSYLEVKTKTPTDRTIKKRRRHPFLDDALGEEGASFVQSVLNGHTPQLQPTLQTNFHRVMLVGRATPERLTIDTDIRFEHGGRQVGLDGIVLVELKQSRLRPRSPAFLLLRNLRAERLSVSKYCTGLALLKDHLRRGPLSRDLRRIERMHVR